MARTYRRPSRMFGGLQTPARRFRIIRSGARRPEPAGNVDDGKPFPSRLPGKVRTIRHGDRVVRSWWDDRDTPHACGRARRAADSAAIRSGLREHHDETGQPGPAETSTI